jgi:ABC-type transport system involved in cytochrome bd biosynthesis fused ATPase/permease subunit
MLKLLHPYILNAIASAFVGFLIGTVNIFLQATTTNPLSILASSSLIGLIIGTTSKLSAAKLHRLLPYKASNFFSTFVVIALGMFVTLSPFKLQPTNIIILVTLAEILGLFITHLNQQYSKKLNEKLKEKQKILKQKNPFQ